MHNRRNQSGQTLSYRISSQPDQIFEVKTQTSLDLRYRQKQRKIKDENRERFQLNEDSSQEEISRRHTISSNDFPFVQKDNSNYDEIYKHEVQHTINSGNASKFFVPLYRLAPSATQVPIPQFVVNGS